MNSTVVRLLGNEPASDDEVDAEDRQHDAFDAEEVPGGHHRKVNKPDRES